MSYILMVWHVCISMGHDMDGLEHRGEIEVAEWAGGEMWGSGRRYHLITIPYHMTLLPSGAGGNAGEMQNEGIRAISVSIGKDLLRDVNQSIHINLLHTLSMR